MTTPASPWSWSGWVILTGTLEALLLLPTPAALISTGYGLVLVAKLAGVIVALALAMTARRRFRRSIAAHAPALGREARIESLTLISVLAIAALLVSAAPPGPATTALAAPPPPIGPTVPAGTLAGYLTLIATASAGQLVIRASTPDRDDLGTTNGTNTANPAPPDYRATARLSTPNTGSQTLTLRGCGPGCFTSPVRWSDGANLLHVDISAPRWPAAPAQLVIPWPPHPDTTLLPRMLTAMPAVPTMTVHQAVTSNYTGEPGAEIPLRISGPDYLAAEPYAGGGGNPTALPLDAGVTELRLYFPQGIAIRLLVGPDAQILREEETNPNHLITSTFEYPAAKR
jgi:copper transport protein